MSDLISLLKSYSDIIIAAAAIVTLLVGFHKKYIAPTLTKIDAGMDLITAQLTDNGGGTLIDKVNQIPVIKEQLTHLVSSEDMATLTGRVNAIEQRQVDGARTLQLALTVFPPDIQEAVSKVIGRSS